MSRTTVGASGRFAGVIVCLLVLAFASSRSQTPPPPATPVKISAGAVHSLAIDPSGAIWSWGTNANGRLGDGPMRLRVVVRA